MRLTGGAESLRFKSGNIGKKDWSGRLDQAVPTAENMELVLQKNFSLPAAPFAVSFSVPEIMRRCGLAGETGCRLQVVPVTCAEEWGEIAGLGEGGADVSAEICPRCVVFNRIGAVRIGATAGCAPPWRGEATWVEMVRWVRSSFCRSGGRSDFHPVKSPA